MSYAFVRRPACELCRHDSPETLLRRPFLHPTVWDFLADYYDGRIRREDVEAGHYEIARCPRCGFLWQVEVLAADGMAALYGRWISAAESLAKKRLAGVDLFAGYARQVEAASRLLGRPPHDVRVLDHGMGWGYWLRLAAAYGHPARGWEIDPERRRFAREELGVEVLADEAALYASTFDFVNAEQVFEHVPDPLADLRRLVGTLAPGGVVRIAVPDAAGAPRRLDRPGWRAAKDALHPLEHVNGFTNRTLRRLARGAGLEPLPRQPDTRPGGPFSGGPREIGKTLLGPVYGRRMATTLWFRRAGSRALSGGAAGSPARRS